MLKNDVLIFQVFLFFNEFGLLTKMKSNLEIRTIIDFGYIYNLKVNFIVQFA